MGAKQSSDLSACVGAVIPEALEGVHMELFRHAKVLSEISSLTYDDFKECLDNLNSLSRKCIDPNGKQLVFLVKNGSDTSLLWKATVRIACIKVDPNTRKIESYKFLNLKQFLCVFKTFQAHLESLLSSEQQRETRRGSQSPSDSSTLGSPSSQYDITASQLMQQVNALTASTVDQLNAAGIDECSICLDRSTDLILPCTHSFCTPCIEQWNVGNKTCPICCEKIPNSKEMWVLSNIPGVEEINEEICAELMSLYKTDNEETNAN